MNKGVTLINQGIKRRYGGFHSAKIALQSVNFAEIEQLQRANDWDQAARILINAAKSVESAGADFVLICTNTMHKVAEQVQASISIPLVHIADSTAHALQLENINSVGLLGTRFTMQETFYRERLMKHHGISVIVPTQNQQDIVHNIIFSELCLGKVEKNSRMQYCDIVQQLYDQGAQAVILGCTEIVLLLQQQHTAVPLFDTTAIHAEHAVRLAVDDGI